MLSGQFRDGTLYVGNIAELRLPEPVGVGRDDVDEHEVDAKCKENLVNAAGFDEAWVRFGKTGINAIDAAVPSKQKANGKGKLDLVVLRNSDLLVVVEDKTPKDTVDVALDEALFYCNGLLEKKVADIRIAVGYNGKEVRWLVRCHGPAGEAVWRPFLVNGIEVRAFPTPDIVQAIYSHDGLTGIVEDRSQASKQALTSCVNALRQRYRQLPFIQNDNHTAIDFTIAFISLKSILEKHGDLLPKADWRWGGLRGATPEALKLNIGECVRHICNQEDRARDAKDFGSVDLAKNFRDVFHQKTKNYTFDFPGLIAEFRTKEQVESLRSIYDEVSKLPPLHSSRIDLFGETYELLADKRTKAAFGQFFTGRHIIRPKIRLLLEGETSESISGGIQDGKPLNPKKFCDPAAGTGGFLTETFKNIRDLFAAQAGEAVDVNEFARKAFFGYDIFPANITKTKINLYLAGDGFSELESLNTLTAKIGHQFDYILTNPPYGAGETVVDSSVISSNRLEVNFLVRIVQLLKAGGKALVVLPDGVFEAPSLAPLRDWLIRQCRIDKIIGLPKFAFAPYTKEKTYSLFITKRGAPLTSVDKAAQNGEKVWFYIVDNDGYANSDKRFPTGRKDAEGRWIHDELSEWIDASGTVQDCLLIQRWRQGEQEPGETFADEWGNTIPGRKFGCVKLSEILKLEFSSCETLPKSEALKIVQDALTPTIMQLTADDCSMVGATLVTKANGKRVFMGQDGKKPVSDATVLRGIVSALKASGRIPAKAEHLFDEDGSFKQEFTSVLEERGIVWDEGEAAFTDQNKPPRVTKLLNLLPEKYFREVAAERVLVGDFAQEVDRVEAKFNALIASLSAAVSGKASA